MARNSNVTITWLGHATFYVESAGGKAILIDPFLQGNPRCPAEWKTIERCDLILITHAHGDHMADAIPTALRTGARVVTIVELAGWLESKGVSNVTGMNKGGTMHLEGISVTMVNAFHTSGIEDGGSVLYGGEPAGFVVRLENGFTFYHAGDTNVFGDMTIIGELYKPALAMLPIGDHYTMGPREAAKAIRLLGVKQVIPMHYGTFPVLTGSPQQLRELTMDVDGLTIHVLEPGRPLG